MQGSVPLHYLKEAGNSNQLELDEKEIKMEMTIRGVG